MSWWAWLLIGIAVVIAVWPGFVIWLVAVGRRGDARALATFIPDWIVLVPPLARDPRVPRRKMLLLGLAGYLVLPFDLVPTSSRRRATRRRDHRRTRSPPFVRSGGEPLLRELWPGPGQSLALILRLALAG